VYHSVAGSGDTHRAPAGTVALHSVQLTGGRVDIEFAVVIPDVTGRLRKRSRDAVGYR